MIMIRRREGSSKARFAPGDLVRHRRYGYRGVVVEFDLVCEANDDWYESNQTQPRKDQPWYHVLVHQSPHTTYAAEDSLLREYGGEEISHPLLQHFFVSFEDGAYVRNERPWG